MQEKLDLKKTPESGIFLLILKVSVDNYLNLLLKYIFFKTVYVFLRFYSVVFNI